MDDYQPESAHGVKNPACNLFLYSRCARLLEDVERAVIYGGSLTNAPSITNGVSDKNREHIADTLSQPQTEKYDGIFNGELYYKRVERKSMFHLKPWKLRYFVIARRVLICYHEAHSVEPLRAIPLINCSVVVCETRPKYGNTCFEVVNESNGMRFQLRAKDEATRQKWVDLLLREINGAPPAVPAAPVEDENNEKFDGNALSHRTISKKFGQLSVTECELTSEQRKRFHHFRQQRIFITNLTNICERLRFQDLSVRRHFLQRDMKNLVVPPLVNIPLCNSLDTFGCVLRALPAEGHAFSTKARVPALMFFEVQTHSRGLDVATFLNREIELYSEGEIVVPGMEIMCGPGSEPEELSDVDMFGAVETSAETEIVERQRPRLNSSVALTPEESAWKEEGTGMQRLIEYNKSQGVHGVALPTSDRSSSPPVTLESVPVSLQLEDVSLEAAGTLIGETFEAKAARLRSRSPYGHLPGWKLDGLIAKSNDDVRQEVFVMQLIAYYQKAFREAKLDSWLHTYRILSTGKSTGLIQLIPNAISLDGLKKKEKYPGSLPAYFAATYGPPEAPAHKAAVRAFITSMAGYSVVSYLLAIKDRHNGNIMIDTAGHVIHIDFGFVFGLAPGKAFSMEKAPFKLTAEMAAVMGGRASPEFAEYSRQCAAALLVARKHAQQVVTMMEIMMHHSNYPAFLYNSRAIEDFKSRLFLGLTDKEVETQVGRLIARSHNSLGARLYDDFQLATNGIAP